MEELAVGAVASERFEKWRTIRDWEPDLMGLGPIQGHGSGKVAENVRGVNWDFLKSGGGGGVWPGCPPGIV